MGVKPPKGRVPDLIGIATCGWQGCDRVCECSLRGPDGEVLGWFCEEHGRVVLSASVRHRPAPESAKSDD